MATLNPFDPNFKLSICDGPIGAPGVTEATACNFKTLIGQVQFIMNAAIMLGILLSIVGFCYAGFLYMSGEQGKIQHAKDIFRKTVIGIVIMLSAWFIVFQLLTWFASNSGVKTLLGV